MFAFLVIYLIVVRVLATTEATSIIVKNATKDNYLGGGIRSSANYGGSTLLNVGPHVRTKEPFRPIFFFPLVADENDPGIVLDGDALVSAKVQLSIRFTDSNHIRCRTETQLAGCARLFLVTKEWGEGITTAFSARDGASSWIHNQHPSQWTTPGGDFDPSPIGRRSVASEVDEDQMGVEGLTGLIAEFNLDVSRMGDFIRNRTGFFGFIMIDDDDLGGISFEARECGARTISSCPNSMAPRLVLGFSDDNAETSAPPTASPTVAPSVSPTTSLAAEPTSAPTIIPSVPRTASPTSVMTESPSKNPESGSTPTNDDSNSSTDNTAVSAGVAGGVGGVAVGVFLGLIIWRRRGRDTSGSNPSVDHEHRSSMPLREPQTPLAAAVIQQNRDPATSSASGSNQEYQPVYKDQGRTISREETTMDEEPRYKDQGQSVMEE